MELPRALRPVRVAASSHAGRFRAGVGLCLIAALGTPLHAGDILRGGASAGATNTPAGVPATGPVPQTATLPRAQDSLARTAAALQAVRTMQATARTVAVGGPNNLGPNPNRPGLQLPNVPNGLAVNGLQIAPAVPRNLEAPAAGENPALWQGARLPVESTSGGRTNVSIRQTAQQSLLTWSTFNLGKETTLTFDQSAGGANQSQWVALNRILDPSGAPSQILGSIQAGGQVFVLNQNGVIFGGSSQVRVHTLLASTLPLNENLLARGLLNNPDLQFLFTQLPVSALAGGSMPAFTPPVVTNPTGRNGDIEVRAGAQLSSPTSADGVGGRIALIGANVRNAGSIATPDGQTILAAGLQVGLLAHPGSDPSLRGLDTFIGATDAFSGSATNTGLIEVPRGNLTIAGASVAQLGAVESSTSVSLNGRIDLIASFNATRTLANGTLAFTPGRAGTVTFGANSVTRIVPEIDSTARVVGTRLALSSLVSVQGQAVYFAPDSTLLAPSANLPSDSTRPALGLDGRALEAGVSLNAGSWLPGAGAVPVFVRTDGQIYLDRGALIDASGTRGAAASVTDNIVTAELRGTELADAPLQRDGPLRGQSIQVDLRQSGTFNGQNWIGTPLADVSGFVNLVQRTVGVLTTAGGTIALNAGGSIVLQPGAALDVSGGTTEFAGGLVQTTRLIAGNRIFDISEATPDRAYDGIYRGFTSVSERYGIVQNFSSALVHAPQFEAGYTSGAAGGAISLRAPAMALDGALRGGVTTGPRQQLEAPRRSSLTLSFSTQDSAAPLFLPSTPLIPPTVEFRPGVTAVPVEAFALDSNGRALPLRTDRQRQVVLSPELLGTAGFGALTVDNSDGNVVVPAGVRFEAPAGGALSLSGANVGIFGEIAIPGGSLAFTAFNLSPAGLVRLQLTSGSVTPDPDPARGNFTLGADAVLSTAGSVFDQRFADTPASLQPAVRAGGSVSIRAYHANLASGSAVDVSGGILLGASGRPTYGAGGSITLAAGQDPGLASLLGGTLLLGAELRGYSGVTGGSLSLFAPRVQVGGATTEANVLHLTPEFFRKGGFSRYTVGGLGAMRPDGTVLPATVIAPGTALAPVTVSLLAEPDASGYRLTPTLQPEGVRPAASVSFTAPGVPDAFQPGVTRVRGDLILGEGASIRTDTCGSVTLSGNTVDVLGSIVAPGGSIAISGASNSLPLFANTASALTTTHLGPNALLSAAGVTLLTPNALGQRTGSVLAGGSISLGGNLAAEAGARLDVSGAAGILDLAPGFSSAGGNGADASGTQLVPTRVESNGGSITLSGGQQLFSDATLRGAAGGPSALGGSLTVSSSRFVPIGGDVLTPLDETLVVRQSGAALPVRFYPPGSSAIGRAVLVADGFIARGVGNFVVDSFANSGLSALTLNGTVAFAGPVSLRAARSLAVASGGVLFADNAISLDAPYLRIGSPFAAPLTPAERAARNSIFQLGGDPFFVAPVGGLGAIDVRAQLVDLGNLSLQRASLLRISAPGGDVRGNGTLNVAGRIAIDAGQIYPPTGTQFTIVAYDRIDGPRSLLGSVELTRSGDRQLPLSAGGELSVYASLIQQGGVLRAPLGTINLGTSLLGTPGRDPLSGLAYPATRTLSLLPGSITSVSAVDPRTNAGVVIPYGTNLNGGAWIDPTGTDITSGGLPSKTLTLSATNLTNQPGAITDLTGGGDLYAYRFVPGTGGSRDVLAGTGSFAVLPGYEAGYAPFAPDYGSAPAPGERVYLEASPGLPAGFYTLLPARYALLPGAFLVTPRNGLPGPSAPQADGSSVVAGYRVNALDQTRTDAPLRAAFEVASGKVVRTRAEYVDSLANAFFAAAAEARDTPPPRLPRDAGRLAFAALQTLTVQGTLRASAPTGALGAAVDLATPADIFIGGPGAVAPVGSLALDAATLSAFGAESLLIGGFRTFEAGGSRVTVLSNNVTVDNRGNALSGPDVTLVANRTLTLAAGAEIRQQGTAGSSAETLLLGRESVAGSGNGVLLRLSADENAGVVRAGVTTASGPALSLGASARLTANSLTLDSTAAATLDPSAVLSARATTLSSGRLTLALDGAGALPADAGLVLGSNVLGGLQSGARSLALFSYGAIDFYGSGTIGTGTQLDRLSLRAVQLRGFGAGEIVFAAREIALGNSAGGEGLPSASPTAGSLEFRAETIRLGFTQLDPTRSNRLAVESFAALRLSATQAIVLTGRGGRDPGLSVSGALALDAPLLRAELAAEQALVAGGALTLTGASAAASAVSGLGARLLLEGDSVSAGSRILLPSGTLTLRARGGDLSVDGTLDVAGLEQRFHDVVRTTGGGTLQLASAGGSVRAGPGSILDVSAPAGSEAGSISVSAPTAGFVSAGTLLGTGGSFALDVASLPNTAALQAQWATGGFTRELSLRIRTGSVVLDGTSRAQRFDLSVDAGSLTVSGSLLADGLTGGRIALASSGDLTLASGSLLSVAAQRLDASSQGGSIFLGTTTGQFNLAAGSFLDAAVASVPTAGGTFHFRAPTSSFNLLPSSFASFRGARSIVLEGFTVLDAASTTPAALDSLQPAARAAAEAFMANADAIAARFAPGDTRVSVRPGLELRNSLGDLVLESDWDLSTWRFGPTRGVVDDVGNPILSASGQAIRIGSVPGLLTLRAAGSLVLRGSLTDGFGNSAGEVPSDGGIPNARWRSELLPLFDDGTPQLSWSFRLASGADLSAADPLRVRPQSQLATDSGSLQLGRDGGLNITFSPGPNATSAAVLNGHYQVIRTGAGSIEVAAGRDVQLLNPFATIYTAGARVADPTLGGTFDTPILNAAGGQRFLGALQQNPIYRAQFSSGGGDVSVRAQGDIVHLTRDQNGVLIEDSSRELPTNWLYRRGYVDPTTGRFGLANFGDVASTAWWIDFSNFFQGIGALGGGNVSLVAGRDIRNVDAVIPTNARLPGRTGNERATPDAAALVELGGGDLTVRAGRDLDAGVYYVERGNARLGAGGQIRTNATRTPSLGSISGAQEDVFDQRTWLPTTLFVGKGNFDVTAVGDLLLGPVANPFLLPGGYSNTFWYKTYFSTYAATSGLSATSLTGEVTLRNAATLPVVGAGAAEPLLEAWYRNVQLLIPNTTTVASFQPWLRLDETDVSPFRSAFTLLPGTLRLSALQGDVNLVGTFNLAPAARGTAEIAARGAINGLQPSGVVTLGNAQVLAWSASSLNLSDADPARLPSQTNPSAYQTLVGTVLAAAATTGNTAFLAGLTGALAESGATSGPAATLDARQARHASGLLHLGDAEPLRLYALEGDVTGFTLFSPKASRILAGRDIADVALYLQNLSASDVSIVSAGRDLTPYAATSALRIAAQSAGNLPNAGELPEAGDLQIGGPGALQTLAGRNFDLGVAPNNGDGTGLGLTSIGNARNPSLPFAGASLFAGAGLGPAASLAGSALDFPKFEAAFLDPAAAGTRAGRYLAELRAELGLGESASSADIFGAYRALPAERRSQLALGVFYRVLRNSARDRTDPTNPDFGTYAAGEEAIKTLFPATIPPNSGSASTAGSISLTSRQIKTFNGGDISVFAPGGGLLVGFDVQGVDAADQGVLTQAGGSIGIFTRDSVVVGTSRIFTLRGGNIIIWSTLGDIAAGSSSKTVQAAPPTRVLVDPQSGAVATDLAGLATGGGIGVLATVAGVPPGDVDLIAPSGVVDAGDAGIRVSGNLNISAVQVVNAGNIATGGTSTGVPTVAAPNLGGLTNASTASAAATGGASEAARQNAAAANAQPQDLPSIISVEVLGYGGGTGESEEKDDEEQRRRRSAQSTPHAPRAALPHPPQAAGIAFSLVAASSCSPRSLPSKRAGARGHRVPPPASDDWQSAIGDRLRRASISPTS